MLSNRRYTLRYPQVIHGLWTTYKSVKNYLNFKKSVDKGQSYSEKYPQEKQVISAKGRVFLGLAILKGWVEKSKKG